MAVKLIDDRNLWDKFIEDSPYGTLFHKWDFLRIVEKHSECKLYPYGIYRGDELICVFPLFITSSLNEKIVFSPPPNLAIPHLGFVMNATYDKLKQRRKETYVNDTMDDIEAEIKKLHAKYVYISTVNEFVDMRPFKWNGYNVQMRYSYRIDLKRPLDAIWNDLDDGLKREIEDAEKRHLSMAPADIGQFYGSLLEMRRRNGQLVPFLHKDFLKDVLAAFPDNVKIEFLYDGDHIVNLAAYYQYKKRFVLWIWLPGMDNGLHSSEYIAWHYLKTKKSEGLETFDMPGASIKQQGLLKSRFNSPLIYNFSIMKNDLTGRIAEAIYDRHIKALI